MNLQFFSQIKVGNRMLLLGFLLLQIQLLHASPTLPEVDEEILLVEAIQSIGRKYQVMFSYDRAWVNDVKVDYNETDTDNLEEALKSVLSQTDLNYQIFDQRYVAVYRDSDEGLASLQKMIEHFQGIVDQKQMVRKRMVNSLAPISSYSSQDLFDKRLVINVQGKVLDKAGEPLIGVNVLVKGTDKGTATDFDGNFVLDDIDENAILLISYIGYQSKEIAVTGKTSITIILQEDSQTLDEVVVVGYGTQKKSDLTGSVSSLKGDDVLQASTASFDQMIQGKVPGVQINQTSGAPGGGNVNILIRGMSSITGGNQPLYVIDGFPVSYEVESSDLSSFGSNTYSSSGIAGNVSSKINPLSLINPSDIESIEVLKDASATAIYGSRGSNGVVIITTKRGEYNSSEINLNTSYGFQQVANKMEMMDAQEYAEFVADGRDNAWVFTGGSLNDPNDLRPGATQVRPEFRNPSSISTNTDWQDVIFRNSPVRELQLSARGGNDRTKYFISTGVFSQEGIILSSNYDRYSFRINLDSKVTDRIKIGSSTLGSYGSGQFANAEGHYAFGGVVAMALAASPTIPVYDQDGGYYFNVDDVSDGLGWLANPLSVIDGFSDKRKSLDIITNNYIEFELSESLKLKSSIGVNSRAKSISLWRSSAVPRGASLNYPATSGTSKTESINWINENVLNYNKIVNRKHLIDGLVGFSVQKNSLDILSAGAGEFPTEYVPYLSAGIVNSGDYSISEWSLLSLISRINYNYDGKYLFTATLRRDGSSRFGGNNKWGTFPSVSVGYNIAEENFIKEIDLVTKLKLRASYGVSGNNQIGNYEHIGLLQNVNYINSGSIVSGLIPSNLSNENLTWEVSKQLNFGLELGIFQNRISILFDIYRDLKTDLLLAVQLPSASGFETAIQNVGDIENKGIELGVDLSILDYDNLKWDNSLTFSANKNKVLKLSTDGSRIFNSSFQVTEVGHSISEFYLLNKLGIFQSESELQSSALQHPLTQEGDIKFEDVNKDGVIDQGDRKHVGSPWPDFTWGLNSKITYKNFGLSISVIGSHGASTYFQAGSLILNSAGVQNQLKISDERWRSSSDPGAGVIPRAIRNNYAFGATGGNSTHFLFDASFIRIKNLNLSYSFKESLLENWKIKDLSLYCSVSNLYTFTEYPGYNPESSTAGNNVVNSGIDYLTYPLSRTMTFGLNITF